ncbi:MAG: SDR family NAD(P)-dependent oxidoreductase [Caulobacteraceae bacterium]
MINGVQTFAEAMIAQGTPALIVNTGSKQGITTPPGNPAYNVSKAGVKALTEALQHELRKHRGLPGDGAPAGPRLHLHGPDPRARGREAAGRLDRRPRWPTSAGRDRGRRLLHPVPRQRRHPRHGQQADGLGDGRPDRETARRCRAGHPHYAEAFTAFMAQED